MENNVQKLPDASRSTPVNFSSRENKSIFSMELMINERKDVLSFSLPSNPTTTDETHSQVMSVSREVHTNGEGVEMETKEHPNGTSMDNITSTEPDYIQIDSSSIYERDVKIPRRNFGPDATSESGVCDSAMVSDCSIEALQPDTTSINCNNCDSNIIHDSFSSISEFISNAQSEIDDIMAKLENNVDRVIALRTLCDAKKNRIVALLPRSELNMINYEDRDDSPYVDQ